MKKTPDTPGFKADQLEYIKEIFGVDFHPDITAIPEGVAGECEVKHEFDLEGEFIYQKLYRRGEEIASNHPGALERHKAFLRRARGRVLVSGLGLGETLFTLLDSPQVEHITVIEADPDVIALLAPILNILPTKKVRKLDVIEHDIFTYKPPKHHYDCVYHSVWSEPSQQTKDQEVLLRGVWEPLCDWLGFVFQPTTWGGVREGAGRKMGSTTGPTRKPSEQRSVSKGVRFTPPEIALIQKAADMAGVTESRVIQRGAIEEAKKLIQKFAALSNPEFRQLLDE